ncbi:MAG: GFA family protein [Rhodospirillaceae bacterium]|nr:MAG: GFA family protein [Rhodospirillaceae bacterium]
MAIEGGCLCGAVRYQISGKPVATAVCHCKNCQKQSGTAFSIVFSVKAKELSVDGALSTFEDVGSSGAPVLRKFCGKCGSPILSEIAALSHLRFIKAGTLDDTSWLKPQIHIWCDSAQSWVERDPALPQFPREPTG